MRYMYLPNLRLVVAIISCLRSAHHPLRQRPLYFADTCQVRCRLPPRQVLARTRRCRPPSQTTGGQVRSRGAGTPLPSSARRPPRGPSTISPSQCMDGRPQEFCTGRCSAPVQPAVIGPPATWRLPPTPLSRSVKDMRCKVKVMKNLH
jgi:hypothetical protein